MYYNLYIRLEGIAEHGEETVYVEGLPMGRTPEFIQERLSRYFARFGAVSKVYALPNKLDAYQCAGSAFVSFKEYLSQS